MRTDRRLVGLLLAAVVLWTAALAVLLGSEQNGLIDLRVYRTGGLAWLRDLALYDRAFPWSLPGPQLPFTYPPLAAVLFAGLAVLPWWMAVALVIGSGVAGLAVTCWLVASRLSTRDLPAVLLAVGAVAAAPLLEPVRETVSFGQVNLLLMGAIAADCLLRRTPWPRGMLIGLAAALKLTPAAFLLFFVARRQWRPVVVAAATFVAAAGLGWLLAPSDTRQYWFGALLEPARIGGLEFTSNQSLRGTLHRFGLPAGVETATWLGLSAVIGVLALLAVARLRRAGDDAAALLVTAAAALLVSPVSWSHHWVWAVPGLLWLVVHSRHRPSGGPRRAAALPPGVFLVFATAPFWWLPYREERELHWAPWQHVLGNAYVWVGLAVVITAALSAVRRRPTATASRSVTSGTTPGQG